MGVAYKNFWSLNTDEAIAAGILRNKTPKDTEVLIPLNAQMKGIDLYLISNKTKKLVTIQVKGSRAYEPKNSETKKYGEGSAGWFFFKKEVVIDGTADYFCFLIYVLEEDKKQGRRLIKPHTILIPTKVLKENSLKYKDSHGDNRFSYKIWVNPSKKEAFDFRDENKKGRFSFDNFLDNSGFLLINKELYK
jgi:hypothetical protein